MICVDHFHIVRVPEDSDSPNYAQTITCVQLNNDITSEEANCCECPCCQWFNKFSLRFLSFSLYFFYSAFPSGKNNLMSFDVQYDVSMPKVSSDSSVLDDISLTASKYYKVSKTHLCVGMVTYFMFMQVLPNVSYLQQFLSCLYITSLSF